MSPEKVAILVVAGLIAVLLAVALLGTESNGNGAATSAPAAKAAPEKPKPAPKQIEEYTYTDIVKGGARFRPEPKAPVESQPAPTLAATTEYTIRSGDTIDKIARRELGSRDMAPKILALNKGVNPSKLKIGNKLVLPVLEKKAPAEGVLAAAKPKTGVAPRKKGDVVAKASKRL